MRQWCPQARQGAAGWCARGEPCSRRRLQQRPKLHSQVETEPPTPTPLTPVAGTVGRRAARSPVVWPSSTCGPSRLASPAARATNATPTSLPMAGTPAAPPAARCNLRPRHAPSRPRVRGRPIVREPSVPHNSVYRRDALCAQKILAGRAADLVDFRADRRRAVMKACGGHLYIPLVWSSSDMKNVGVCMRSDYMRWSLQWSRGVVTELIAG